MFLRGGNDRIRTNQLSPFNCSEKVDIQSVRCPSLGLGPRIDRLIRAQCKFIYFGDAFLLLSKTDGSLNGLSMTNDQCLKAQETK